MGGEVRALTWSSDCPAQIVRATKYHEDIESGQLELLPLISALHQRCASNAWSTKIWNATLNNSQSNVTACFDQTSLMLVGVCVTQLAQQEAELHQVFVDPDLQRRGIGRLLINDQISQLGKLNIERIFLEVSEENICAIGLYKSIGFNIIGHRPKYYLRRDGKYENALVMSIAPLSVLR